MRSQTKIILTLTMIVIMAASCTGRSSRSDTFPTDTAIPNTAKMVFPTADVNSSDYMKACLKINNAKTVKQIGFQGIYPGKTTGPEMLSILGEPEITEQDFDGQSNYFGDIHILLVDGIVHKISDYNIDEEVVTLGEIIQKYGCPDLIFTAYRDGFWVFMVYYTAGLELSFSKDLPLSLDDSMSYIDYFVPIDDFSSYSEKVTPLNYFNDIRFISWDEAVQENQ